MAFNTKLLSAIWGSLFSSLSVYQQRTDQKLRRTTSHSVYKIECGSSPQFHSSARTSPNVFAENQSFGATAGCRFRGIANLPIYAVVLLRCSKAPNQIC